MIKNIISIYIKCTYIHKKWTEYIIIIYIKRKKIYTPTLKRNERNELSKLKIVTNISNLTGKRPKLCKFKPIYNYRVNQTQNTASILLVDSFLAYALE